MTITKFLNDRGFLKFEGYSQQVPKQVEDLIKLSKGSNIHVMEIGFNAGHSAEIFLKNNDSLILTSFDLGTHDYLSPAKEYIDLTYPNRHNLILGNSIITIPEYIKNNPNKTFDVIFIDGGHNYKIANSDLKNCKNLANKNTVVIMDDTIYTRGWEAGFTLGPTKTWLEHINNGMITEINRVDYRPHRGMSWGNYVF